MCNLSHTSNAVKELLLDLPEHSREPLELAIPVALLSDLLTQGGHPRIAGSDVSGVYSQQCGNKEPSPKVSFA